MNRFLLGLCLLLSWSLVLSPHFAEGAARRRGRSRNNAAAQKAAKERAIKAAQSQYAAAESVLHASQASGNSATARLQAVVAALSAAAQEMREAHSNVKSLAKDLLETEEDILQEQTADSPYVLLIHEIGTIKQRMAAIENELFSTSDYVTKKSAAQSESAMAVIRLRTETLEHHPEYLQLKIKFEGLASDLIKLKHQLFEADAEWQSLHRDLIAARKEESAALTEVYAHAPDRGEPMRNIKDAKQAAAVAENAMAQARSILSRYGAGTKSSVASKSGKR